MKTKDRYHVDKRHEKSCRKTFVYKTNDNITIISKHFGDGLIQEKSKQEYNSSVKANKS